MDDPSSWSREGLLKRVGSILFTSFWADYCLGDISLSVWFFMLFSIFDQKAFFMGEFVNWRVSIGFEILSGVEPIT